MAEPLLRVDALSKAYGRVKAVDDVTLEIAAGEFFALLGPSGCGKTTLMRLVAGFETPDAGRVLLEGRDITAEPPNRRPVNMMFQSYALFPHLDVAGNVGFALRRQGLASGAVAARVKDMLRLVQLDGYEARRPHQLSGGQKARVALARALAARPRLLLLDEPLAALDRKLREETQFELMQVQRDLGVAFLVVTHDQDEAIGMAQRIAVMRDGRLEQVGPARDIYEKPASRWAARFIGDANVIEARVRAVDDTRVMLDVSGATFEAPHDGDPPAPGADVALCVRSERMRLSPSAPSQGAFEAEVLGVSYFGDTRLWRLRTRDGLALRVSRPAAEGEGPQPGDVVFVSYETADARVLAR